MKIVRAMKKVSRLQGEIRDLKERINSSVSTLEENDYDESFEDLNKILVERVCELIQLKDRIMRTNIKHRMFKEVLKLGEAKSSIAFIKSLDVRQGAQSGRGYLSSDKEVYKSQVSKAQRNAFIDELQKEINEITDKLDEFNAATDLVE